MVSGARQHLSPTRRRRLWIVIILAVLTWIVTDTQAFVNLWLTPDQQGRLWFELGYYQRASRTFEDPRWRGFSLYAGQEFDQAVSNFSRFNDANSLLLHANALAHQRKYHAARRAYQKLAKHFPDNPALEVNLRVIDALIEADKEGYGSETSDEGQGKRRPGAGSQSSEGEERQDIELEQLSAGDLLQDPGLTDMWLRQIQRDPSEFLSTKFYLELEQEQDGAP